MSRQNELTNIDASQFSLYIQIKENFVEDFNMLYDQKRHAIRGQSIKKFIEEKIDIHGIKIARIDLNYNRLPMIELLEARGRALKVQNYGIINSIEKTINELKLK